MMWNLYVWLESVGSWRSLLPHSVWVDVIIRGRAAATREMKEVIYQQDRRTLVDKCGGKSSSNC